MDYTCVPVHEFLAERVRSLVASRAPFSRHWIWGPCGERYAQYTIQVDVNEDKSLHHIMVQLSFRNETLFSLHGCYNADNKPEVSRLIWAENSRFNVNINTIESAILQVLFDDHKPKPKRQRKF